MNTSKLKVTLKDLYSQYAQAYKTGCDLAYKKNLSELKPGERTPEKLGLYYDDYKTSFAEKASKLKAEGLEAIKKARSEVKTMKTDAPSTDAMNYISYLRTKKDLTEYDIEDALERYGNNYAAYNAIKDLGEERKVFFAQESILDPITRGLDNLESNFEKFGVYHAERHGGISDGYLSFVGLTIDNELPDFSNEE